MKSKDVILVVDNELLSRKIISDILSEKYIVLLESDSRKALEILRERAEDISTVLLELNTPEFSGVDFLREYAKEEELKSIPVMIITGTENNDKELECLELGAWDFLNKPFNPKILMFRVQNAVERSNMYMSKQIQYSEQHDTLTGICSERAFRKKTETMIHDNPELTFCMVRFDIDKFQNFNSFFGMEEGDKLLKYIASELVRWHQKVEWMTYCRKEADVFFFCMPFTDKHSLSVYIKRMYRHLEKYQENYEFIPSFGIAVMNDQSLSVREYMDRCKLVAAGCKGNYAKYYAYYDDRMSADRLKEQLIVNSMRTALVEEQFVLYIQPKYELSTNTLQGGEVLVRWKDPERGMISPGDFIPVFERNGFIMELDSYVWRQTAKLIRKWLDEGKKPKPISVNISRVSLYNPNLVKEICDLIDEFQIPAELFQLELTESAYTSNPKMMKESMEQLQKKGFTILMDDFGSGYSSLNVLKDIVVDVLKIDMRFMSKCDQPGRSENILASVVRMAKWLNMPVIAEGVEEREQVNFLRSIGCEYVQGFYFYRPMPVEDYEQLAFIEKPFIEAEVRGKAEGVDNLWDSSSQMEMLFSNMLQPVAIYEYSENSIEAIRVNDAYYDIFGFKDLSRGKANIINFVVDNYKDEVYRCFETVVRTQGVGECEFIRRLDDGKDLWISLKLKYMSEVGDKAVVFGIVSDITMQKKVDMELQKYRTAMSSLEKSRQTLLIVDDVSINRETLALIFQENCNIWEAENGQEALDMLEQHPGEIDVVLLDMVMPVMDGFEFMEKRKELTIASEVPVIVITADDTREQQLKALGLGASDYIVKPFLPEVVTRRVNNVLESTRRFGQVLRGYSLEIECGQRDELTGLYSKSAADRIVPKELNNEAGRQAMLMVDLDNFKEINEKHGEKAGDKLIRRFAFMLEDCFDECDVVARYGGDEFLVFVKNIESNEYLLSGCEKLLEKLRVTLSDGNQLECSIGVAVNDEETTFMTMLAQADSALSEAKRRGKNRCVIFSEKEEEK